MSHFEQVRSWLGRPLWDVPPRDADVYFGEVLRVAPSGTRLARAQALNTYFEFVELRHKVEIHQMTGRVVEYPIDEMNRPRGRRAARLRIPPTAEQVGQLFAGWRGELATYRKFGPAARNYAAARLMAEVELRINELCYLDLVDVHGPRSGARHRATPEPSTVSPSSTGVSRHVDSGQLQLYLPGPRASLRLGCARDPFYAGYALVLALGLRKGEVLGLVWDDINLDADELTIGRQLQRVRHELLHREPKTATSDDVVLPLVGLCTATLRQRRIQQATAREVAGVMWQGGTWVFSTKRGTPIESHNFNRSFHQASQQQAPSVRLRGTGTPQRDFLHVDAFARACRACWTNPELVNVGTGTDVTIRKLAEMIAAVVRYRGDLE